MALFINASVQELNRSLFSALSGAVAARNVRIAALGRNSGPNRVERNFQQARLDAQAREAVRNVKGYSKLKIKQTRAVKTLEKASERLVEMKNILLEARELIVNAQKSGVTAEAQRDLARHFDQLIGKMNLRAKGAGFFGTNLIGASIRDIFDANDLEVLVRPNSQVTTTYQGTFLGADYVITDGSGNTFLPNIFGSSVVQFPNADSGDIGTLLLNDDIIVYDSATGALTITRAADGSTALSGTLERKGIGVLHSYFYGKFQDSTLRDTALSDVTDALSKLRLNISLFESKQTRAEVALQFSINQIEENRDVAARIQAQKSTAEQKFILEEQKRQFIFEASIQSALSYNAFGLPALLERASFFGFDT